MKKNKKLLRLLVSMVLCLSLSSPVTAKAFTFKPYFPKTYTALMGHYERIPFTYSKNAKYTISDPTIASIKLDKYGIGVDITPKKVGKAVVTAKYKGKTYKCQLTVKKIPFTQEKINYSLQGYLKILEDGSYSKEVYNSMWWTFVPGADGYIIRRTDNGGKPEYKTINGGNSREYRGSLIQSRRDENGEFILFSLGIRAFQYDKNGNKIYSKWYEVPGRI